MKTLGVLLLLTIVVLAEGRHKKHPHPKKYRGYHNRGRYRSYAYDLIGGGGGTSYYVNGGGSGHGSYYVNGGGGGGGGGNGYYVNGGGGGGGGGGGNGYYFGDDGYGYDDDDYSDDGGYRYSRMRGHRRHRNYRHKYRWHWRYDRCKCQRKCPRKKIYVGTCTHMCKKCRMVLCCRYRSIKRGYG